MERILFSTFIRTCFIIRQPVSLVFIEVLTVAEKNGLLSHYTVEFLTVCQYLILEIVRNLTSV